MNRNKESALGYYRDRFSKFCSLRNSSGYNLPNVNLGAKLINSDAQNTQADMLNQYSRTIEQYFDDIENSIDSLKGLYNVKIESISSFAEVQNEASIEASTRQIMEMITRLKGKIDQMKSETKGDSISNMQNGYLARVRDISVRFRAMQVEYLNRLTKIKSQANQYYGSDSIDDENMSDSFNVNFTPQQLDQVNESQQEIERRNQVIQELCDQLRQIQSMFNDLSSLIIEQGTIIDRIDHNISEAINETRAGNKELDEAEKHQKSSTGAFYIYLISMLVLIILLGSLIIIKKEKKRKNQQEQ